MNPKSEQKRRFHGNAGIAIGPILFVIAIMGVLAAAMSTNMSSFGTIGVADRITAEINTQANLIRSKIIECNLTYSTVAGTNDYPTSTGEGTLVEAITCPGDINAGYTNANLWSGPRATQLPPPSQGFNKWTYYNANDTGGRCFWTTITGTKGSGIVEGLTKVRSKFSSQEASYDSTSATQKFVIFVTPPTGTVDSHCAVP